jgi:hypothetical protein
MSDTLKKLQDELKITKDPRDIEALMDDIDDLLSLTHGRGDLEDPSDA